MNEHTPDINNIVEHCLKNEQWYIDRSMDCSDRWINRGWIEALQFVTQNFNTKVKETLIGQKKKGVK